MRPSRSKLTGRGSGVGRYEGRAGDALEGIPVAQAGGVHDAGGQGGGRALPVPAPGVPFTVEMVAEWLLVEARLRTTGLVSLDRPEPRAGGGAPSGRRTHAAAAGRG